MLNKPIRCFEGNAQPHQPFWSIRNAAETGNEPEIELYGVISEFSWFDDEITPKKFRDDLHKVGGGGPITIRINSGGGDVIAASVMRATLLDYPGRKTMRVDGLCASAATVVALAGDRIQMLDTSYWMIHDPAIVVMMAALDIDTLGRLHDSLKAVKDGILSAYSTRTGLSAERLGKMMSDETWMSANEAQKLGFVDEVIAGGKPASAGTSSNVLQNYVHVPAGLHNQAPAPVIDPVAIEAERLSDFAKMFFS
jgi:ATP-dependent Clp protease, protease subunit